MSFLLQSPPGLALTLKKEMVFSGAIERKQDLFIKRQRNHDLLFANRLKNSDGLHRLRVAEAVYRCPVFGRYKISQRQLKDMANELRALGPRRLVVQVAGRVFDRRDIGRWLTKEMQTRDAELNENVEDEVWLFCIDEAYYFAIPLKKARETVGREQRAIERMGSLPPPIAAAMAFVAQPKDTDTILDPVCGSGTLLSEARSYAPGATLLGVDTDSEAVAAAVSNVPDAELIRGDSRTLKFHSGVTLLLANLPFGKQFGDKKTNAELYRAILRNVLHAADRKNWRGVVLTSDAESLQKALKELPEVMVQEIFRVKIRGELATAMKMTAAR